MFFMIKRAGRIGPGILLLEKVGLNIIKGVNDIHLKEEIGKGKIIR